MIKDLNTIRRNNVASDKLFTNLNKFSANGITYNEDWYLPSKVTIDLHDIRTENISFIKHEKLPENILKLCTM